MNTIALTRRGRLLLLGVPTVLAVLTLLAGAMFLATAMVNQVEASADPVGGVEAQQVTVVPGDTLWSIAASAESQEDIQTLMTHIAELNDLDSSTLQPGQVIHVPVD
ncbi:LysM peptidoglycan-binding domain-containing protein [Nesterenkonia flava]|uniref:LysM peptidoglycan-binding domain-containing protein n=1 Tax=Nesterenkonia flava TaxID=469799 RepID=A0ABU1FSI0_9MICC|nr:LysM peptidoglycan-binding domain-containing protein [Nesterenkonia flava]MDR5711627.1 LysM peptidoglycan-binding domain-containing protein [Nesterenkonia flava]